MKILALIALLALLFPAMPTAAGGKPADSSVASIRVFKGERRLDLLDATDSVVRSYKIALGKSPVGNKEAEGDGRTPEGRYIIDARNEKSDYYLSLRISYPDTTDRKRAQQKGVRPGGNIFIHGLPNGKSWMWWKYNTQTDWTDGCIALQNHHMREIWARVQDGTPIVIYP